MPTPLTKRELDRMNCKHPDCDHQDHSGQIFLHGRCHMRGRIDVSYQVGSGILSVACRECKKLIAQIAVQGLLGATGEPATSDTPGDRGSLQAMLSIDGDRLRFDFGKSVAWLTLMPEEATALAERLLSMAATIKESQ